MNRVVQDWSVMKGVYRMSMVAPIVSIMCFAVAAVLGAVAQYLHKCGADAADRTLLGYLLNLRRQSPTKAADLLPLLGYGNGSAFH